MVTKHFKVFISVLLCLVMVFALTGCGNQTKESLSVLNYKSGSYQASAQGYKGPVTVEVTFDTNAIVGAKVISHMETAGIADTPIERIPQMFVDNQSLKIEAISGASKTSNAILAALADCVIQAGGDLEVLKNAELKSVKAGETVEMTADIIVLGGGGAGMAAAYSATGKGASVVVVEKTAALGGNTLRSGGGFNSAGPQYGRNWIQNDQMTTLVQSYIDLPAKNEKMAEWQKTVDKQFKEHLSSGATNLFDSEEFHMLQTYVEGDYIGNPDMIELMCKDAKDLLTWAESIGGIFDFESKGVLGMGSIWPRAYSLIGGHGKGGGLFIDYMKKSMEGKEIDYVMEVAANELIVENGKVVGAKGTKTDGTPYIFHANKAVIIATGGFTANVEMREKYNKKWEYIGEKLPISGSPANTGDGHVMAEKIGAKLIDMSEIQLQPLATARTGALQFVAMPSSPFINQDGLRFTSEAGRRDVMSAAILAQPGGYMYQVCSPQNSWVSDGITKTGDNLERMIADGDVFRADTLEDLAKQLNIDPITFVKTINEYNAAVKAGKDPLTGRISFTELDLIEDFGPYLAHKISPSVHFTMGGIAVDTDLRVLDQNDNIIPGLYAAGEVSGGFHGGNRVGGNAITHIFRTGLNAGINASSNN